MKKENYKSDLSLEVILTLGGVEIPVPDHDFLLVFYTTGKKQYKCAHKGDGWGNCKVVDGRLHCYLDNHGLSAGVLRVEYYDYIPDSNFKDGNQLKVVPRPLDIELIYGAGDDATEISIEVATDITAAVARANAISDDLENKVATDYYRGVGIESIEQTTTSHEDGGENVVTITLTDGEQSKLSVRNGGNNIGDYYTKQQVDAKLFDKADLVGGRVPISQLPSEVDDVLTGRYRGGNFYPVDYNPAQPDYIPDVAPYTPEAGKIYIDVSNNLCYRWDTSDYVVIAGSHPFVVNITEDLWDNSLSADKSYNEIASAYGLGETIVAISQEPFIDSTLKRVYSLIGIDDDAVYFGRVADGLMNTITLPKSGSITQRTINKQDKLVSGTNIKTINGESLLGRGNITIQGGGGEQVQSDWNESDTIDPSYIKNKPDLSRYATNAAMTTALATKADAADVYTKSEIGGILGNAEAWVQGEIEDISPVRVNATWNASTSAYVSNVSVDTMYQSFYTDGKVLELELHNGSWDGSVLLCHGSYVDGNNARHMLFSGIVNGNLVEADVVGTAVTINFAEIADVLSDLQALWNAKQDVLTFDSAPTLGSSNPVTSDGIAQEFDSVAYFLNTLKINDAIVGVVDNNNNVTFYSAVDIVRGNTTNPVSPDDVIAALQQNTSRTIGLMKNNYIISRLHLGYLTYDDGDELSDGIVLIGPESVNPYAQSNGYAVVSVFTQNAIYVHKSTLSELDNAPVANSDKLLSSGSVFTALQGKQDNRLLVTITQSGTDLVADVVVSDIIQAISAGRDVLAVYGIGGRLTEYYKVEGYNQQTRTLVWGLARGIGIKTLSQTGASVTLESKTFAEAAALTAKQDVSPITNAASGALTVNEYRDFGSVSALTITLAGGTMANYDLYKFAFTCASDSTTLTLPSGVKLPVDMEMKVAAGRRFECTIDYANCLTFNCWD